MYCGITEVPECFKVGNGDLLNYSETSAFWIFNTVTNFAYLRYDAMIEHVRERQAEIEGKFIASTPAIDQAANYLFENEGEAKGPSIPD